MSLLDKLKSLLGSDSEGRSRSASQDGATRTDVTVEHEPSAESEHAVEGTDQSPEPTELDTTEDTPTTQTSSVESSDSAETDDSVDSAGADDPADPAESGAAVDEIKGIGPTYAERLEAAGIETVADLAASDAATVAEAAQASEGRAADWVERARTF